MSRLRLASSDEMWILRITLDGVRCVWYSFHFIFSRADMAGQRLPTLFNWNEAPTRSKFWRSYLSFGLLLFFRKCRSVKLDVHLTDEHVRKFILIHALIQGGVSDSVTECDARPRCLSLSLIEGSFFYDIIIRVRRLSCAYIGDQSLIDTH